MSHQAST